MNNIFQETPLSSSLPSIEGVINTIEARNAKDISFLEKQFKDICAQFPELKDLGVKVLGDISLLGKLRSPKSGLPFLLEAGVTPREFRVRNVTTIAPEIKGSLPAQLLFGENVAAIIKDGKKYVLDVQKGGFVLEKNDDSDNSDVLLTMMMDGNENITVITTQDQDILDAQKELRKLTLSQGKQIRANRLLEQFKRGKYTPLSYRAEDIQIYKQMLQIVLGENMSIIDISKKSKWTKEDCLQMSDMIGRLIQEAKKEEAEELYENRGKISDATRVFSSFEQLENEIPLELVFSSGIRRERRTRNDGKSYEVTMCSQTAQENAARLFGVTFPRGDAHKLLMSYPQGNESGCVGIGKNINEAPSGANVADMFFRSGGNRGHRMIGFQSNGKWFVLDPYYTRGNMIPIELGAYEQRLKQLSGGVKSISQVAFYKSNMTVTSRV